MNHISMFRRGLLLLSMLTSGGLTAHAQGVTSGAPGAPDALASLNTQGLLLPRFTALQRLNISNPVAGLLLFQTDAEVGLYYYDGTGWRGLSGNSPSTFGLVSTLAGSSTAGSADGTGSAARFSAPTGLAYDGNGNVYVADQDNNRIRKIVLATGVVSTLAGSSTAGSADGTGSAAQFNAPSGLACDGNGNVFVADQNNNRIRKIVAATGVVSTLAGSGDRGFKNTRDARVSFNRPVGVACDRKGNVFVADQGNNAIRCIRVATGFVYTLAGNGTAGYVDGEGTGYAGRGSSPAQFNAPAGVVCSTTGDVYVADQNNNCIRYLNVIERQSEWYGMGVDPFLGSRANLDAIVSTLAGKGTVGSADGTGPTARFNAPTGLTFDNNDIIYVADQGNNRIRKIVAATGVVTTLAGSTWGYAEGIGTATKFIGPTGVACDSYNNVYVAEQSDQGNGNGNDSNRIRIIK